MKQLMISAVLPAFFMLGCEAEKTAPVQTVDWYLAHEAERKATQKECQNNSGELGQTPNCVNASIAGNRASAKITNNLRF